MAAEFNPTRSIDAIMPFVQIGGINHREAFDRAFLNQFHLGQPIKIAGFIGQGGKDHLGKSDLDLLTKYQRLGLDIGKNYPFGVEVSLIGADLHGQANGKSDNGYLSLIRNKALEFGFNWRQLSELYQEKNLKLPNLENVESVLLERKGDEFQKWDSLPREIKSTFISMAGKHWGDHALLGAFYYFLMRQNEFLLFDQTFRNFLFVINGSSDLAKYVFPEDIPQMYWIDVRDGGRKGRYMSLPPPWFRDD